MDNCRCCFICGNEAEIKEYTRNAKAVSINNVICKTCGEYSIDANFARTIQHEDNFSLEDKNRLSVMIRSYYEENNKQLRLDEEVARNLVEKQKSISMDIKINRIINYVASNTDIGKDIDIEYNQNYIAYAKDANELIFLLNHLEDIGYLDNEPKMGRYSCELTFDGWRYFLNSGGDSKFCFIAMTFTDDEVNKEYKKSVLPVLEKLGFEPVIVNKIQHNKDSVDRIKWGINSSKFVIADTRGLKLNVFYEAGYAMGLKREVIWLCKKGEEGKLPFDTRNLNHIIWETVEDLKISLEDRIKGSILI